MCGGIDLKGEGQDNRQRRWLGCYSRSSLRDKRCCGPQTRVLVVKVAKRDQVLNSFIQDTDGFSGNGKLEEGRSQE